MNREATRDDLPHGTEAQCPLCWRLFGADSTCKKHKPYARPATTTCKDPATCSSLERRERRGLTVWVRHAPLAFRGPQIAVPQELVAL